MAHVRRSWVLFAAAVLVALSVSALAASRHHHHRHRAHRSRHRVADAHVRHASVRPAVRAPAKASSAPRASASLDAVELAILARVNAVRARQQLHPLRSNPTLARVARAYSLQMAQQGFFSHVSPSGTTYVDRVLAADVECGTAGENLYEAWAMPDIAGGAMKGWMGSPGHRANILRPQFTETGIGVWRSGDSWWVTQEFIGP